MQAADKSGREADRGGHADGGVYHLGTFTLDALTLIAFNHASTSNDDTFGV